MERARLIATRDLEDWAKGKNLHGFLTDFFRNAQRDADHEYYKAEHARVVKEIFSGAEQLFDDTEIANSEGEYDGYVLFKDAWQSFKERYLS